MNNNVSRFSHPFFIIFFSSSEDDFEVSLSLSLSSLPNLLLFNN